MYHGTLSTASARLIPGPVADRPAICGQIAGRKKGADLETHNLPFVSGLAKCLWCDVWSEYHIILAVSYTQNARRMQTLLNDLRTTAGNKGQAKQGEKGVGTPRVGAARNVSPVGATTTKTGRR